MAKLDKGKQVVKQPERPLGGVFYGRVEYDIYGRYKIPDDDNSAQDIDDPIKVIPLLGRQHAELSTFVLKRDGQIIENIFSFSAIYKHVPETVHTKSARNSDIVWRWPAEQHIGDDGQLTEAYWAWRRAGMSAPDAIWRPGGRFCDGKLNVPKYYLHNDRKIDYLFARRDVLLPIYIEALSGSAMFNELVEQIKAGRNVIVYGVNEYGSVDRHLWAGWGMRWSPTRAMFTLCSDANYWSSLPRHVMLGFALELAAGMPEARALYDKYFTVKRANN